MKPFLLGVLASALAFTLAAFALRPETASTPAVAKRTAPLRYADLTLDRAFRMEVTVTVSSPLTFQMPAGVGFVLDDILGANPSITINGVTVSGGGITLSGHPLVIRPNDTVTVAVGGISGTQIPMVLVGWNVYAGEV